MPTQLIENRLRSHAISASQPLDKHLSEVFSHMPKLEMGGREADKSRTHVRDELIQFAPIFSRQKYILGDEFSMLDVAIAPLLWRLEHYGISLPRSAAGLMKYAERIFSRHGFIDALTASEKIMRR